LYSDQYSISPENLLLWSDSIALQTGTMNFDWIGGPQHLIAGSYWIAISASSNLNLTLSNTSFVNSAVSEFPLESTYPSLPLSVSALDAYETYFYYPIIYFNTASCPNFFGFSQDLGSTTSLTKNYLTGFLLRVGCTLSIKYVSTLISSSSGGNIQFFLYNDNSGYPGTILYQTNLVSITTGTLSVPFNQSPFNLQEGKYWLMTYVDTTTSIRSSSTNEINIQYTTVSSSSKVPNVFGLPTGSYQGPQFNMWISTSSSTSSSSGNSASTSSKGSTSNGSSNASSSNSGTSNSGSSNGGSSNGSSGGSNSNEGSSTSRVSSSTSIHCIRSFILMSFSIIVVIIFISF